MPDDRRDEVAALGDDRDADDSAMTRVTTPIAASTPSPLRSAHAARDSGVDRTTSSGAGPRRAAQPARNVAPARPMMNEPKPKNVSWRTADGWVRSRPG